MKISKLNCDNWFEPRYVKSRLPEPISMQYYYSDGTTGIRDMPYKMLWIQAARSWDGTPLLQVDMPPSDTPAVCAILGKPEPKSGGAADGMDTRQ